MPKLYFGVPTFNLCDTQCCKEFDVIIVLMEWLRFRVWSWTSVTQNSGRSKWTQYSIGIVLPVRFEPGILYLQIYHVFFKSKLEKNGQFVERYAFVSGLWSEKTEVQISGRLNPTQCYQRLATVTTFLRKELCCPHKHNYAIGPANSFHASAKYVQRILWKIWFDWFNHGCFLLYLQYVLFALIK